MHEKFTVCTNVQIGLNIMNVPEWLNTIFLSVLLTDKGNGYTSKILLSILNR